MERIWQGEVEIVECVRPPLIPTRANFFCPYCNHLKVIYFPLYSLAHKITITCPECEATYKVRLISQQPHQNEDLNNEKETK
jgi:transcription elongation factor Elf1